MKILDVPQSGSVAGTTSSRNRFGQYRRTRAIPTNPNTTAQSVVRSNFSGISSSWQVLEPEEKEAWASWAAIHPRTDTLGQTIILTGAQAFNAVNTLLALVSLPAVILPPADPVPEPPTIGGLVLENDAGDVTGEVTFAPTPVPALTRLLLFVSPPKSPGVSFCKDMRFLSVAAPAAATPLQYGPDLVDKYGMPPVGARYFFRGKLLVSDGGASNWSNVLTGLVTS